MNIQTLRNETVADHLAVEGTVPLMHAELTVPEYVAYLRRFYGIVSVWEESAAAAAPDWLQPILAERRRLPLLDSDLVWFSAVPPQKNRLRLPQIDSLPKLLGAMYVMEGSALGGQFIARHVSAALHLPPGHGNAYFSSDGMKTAALWKEFCEILRTRVPENDTAEVVESAKAMFATFGDWMKGLRAPDVS